MVMDQFQVEKAKSVMGFRLKPVGFRVKGDGFRLKVKSAKVRRIEVWSQSIQSREAGS